MSRGHASALLLVRFFNAAAVYATMKIFRHHAVLNARRSAACARFKTRRPPGLPRPTCAVTLTPSTEGKPPIATHCSPLSSTRVPACRSGPTTLPICAAFASATWQHRGTEMRPCRRAPSVPSLSRETGSPRPSTFLLRKVSRAARPMYPRRCRPRLVTSALRTARVQKHRVLSKRFAPIRSRSAPCPQRKPLALRVLLSCGVLRLPLTAASARWLERA
jgi:hypothetical protein